MATKKVLLRYNAFYGDDEMELVFPENWDVQELHMAGHGKPALSDEQMRWSLRNTIGSPRLSELARGAQKVCILFDDIPKPTPTSRIVPFVLEELHEGGVADEQIRFICAPGTHRPLTYQEFVAKLGRDVVAKYQVYNHSIWENLVDVGKTSRGTPVQINREFASSDLRLGLGSIFPHGSAGFGGGGKMILPGIAGIETVAYHHKNITKNRGVGRVDDNEFRLDLEEAARLAGLQFKVDVVLNDRREVAALFAGDFVAEHRAAVDVARSLYRTIEKIKDADVVVANGWPDEHQLGRTHWTVEESLRAGGDAVIVGYTPDGQILHQLYSRFGSDYGGRGWVAGARYARLNKAGRVFLLAPNLSAYDAAEVVPPGKTEWCTRWDQVLAHLAGRHGAGAQVAVYPYAPLQTAAV